MKCRVCNNEMNLIEKIMDCTIDTRTVYKKPTNRATVDLLFYKCDYCSVGGIECQTEEDYYKNYKRIDTVTKEQAIGVYQESKINYYDDNIKMLKKYCGGGYSHFLDIGCGPGVLLKVASKYFSNCIGVEPSEPLSMIAQELGNVVVNDFFGDHLTFEHKFDAFMATQVFEHLENLNLFMSDIHKVMNEGGVGFIEVPNGQRIMDNSEYYNVFLEHINYFTPRSLIMLAENNGFEVISISEAFAGAHLKMYVRKINKKLSFKEKRLLHQQKLNKIIDQYNVVSFWGAGVKARSFSTLINDTNKIKYIFDSNPQLENMYINHFPMPIEKPNSNKLQENDLIVIFALEFSDEIIKLLREDYQYKGDIYVLDGNLIQN